MESKYDLNTIFFHASLLQDVSVLSMGTEVLFGKNISVHSRFCMNTKIPNSTRNELSVRWYPLFEKSKFGNPHSQLTFRGQRPQGVFFSLGFSEGVTNVDLLVGKKAYLGEEHVPTPLVFTGYFGPSYFVGENKVSGLVGTSIGFEF
jgi:hypothetical protein